jgi:NAD(P)-dependent dehydrogenase (short-subunit alcohol dehydrogenase family)
MSTSTVEETRAPQTGGRTGGGQDRRSVVVTGASSGIGEASALHLEGLGFHVFAGVRKEADAERLRRESAGNVTPLSIDVTDQQSISAAAAQVEQAVGERGLAGLVNNAGVAISGPLEFIPIEELRRQLEINLVGQVAVTQAFLALLRKGRGRVVNVSSIGGRIALPFAGPYAASKFGIEAVSDSLRRELRPWGIEVSVIEPGSVATRIWEKGTSTARELSAKLPPEGHELYGGAIALMQKAAAETAARGIPPEEVAKDVAHALTASKPKTRYLVGRDAKMRARVARFAPDRVFDRMIARALGM